MSTWEVSHLGAFANDSLTREWQSTVGESAGPEAHYLHLGPALLPARTVQVAYLAVLLPLS